MLFPRFQQTASLLLSMILVGGVPASAADHVVPMAELETQISSHSRQRRANLSKAESFLSLQQVQQVLRSAKIDSAKLDKAVRGLGDDELAKFAARADRVQADLRAGALSNQELTYIVIALVTAVVILVIVVA